MTASKTPVRLRRSKGDSATVSVAPAARAEAPRAEEKVEDVSALPSADELVEAWLPGWLATPLAVAGARIVPGEKLEKAASPGEPLSPLSQTILQAAGDDRWRLARRDLYFATIGQKKELVSFDLAREFGRSVAAFAEKTRLEALANWRRLYDDRGFRAIPNFVKWKARCIRREELTSGARSLEVLSGEVAIPDPGPEPERLKKPGLVVEKTFADLALVTALCKRVRAYPAFESLPEPFPVPAALAERLEATVALVRRELGEARSLLERIPERREFDEILALGENPQDRTVEPEEVERIFARLSLEAWERAKATPPNPMIEARPGEPRVQPWIEKEGTWAEGLVQILREEEKRQLRSVIAKDKKRLEALADDESKKVDERQRRFTERIEIGEQIKKRELELASLEA